MARQAEPEDGVQRRSATQINTWLECERKFGWVYIAKIPRVEHASAALGSACHTQLERYLEHGTPLDFGIELGGRHPAKIIEPSLPYLPAPKTPGMHIEQYFKWTSPSGHLFIGYKDLRIDASARGGVPLVIDHKTTSDIGQWAKRPSELPTDPQAVIYAADEFAKAPDAPAVDLMWVYSQTKGPRRSEPVRLRVLRDDPTFLRAVRAVDLVAGDISQHTTSKTAVLDLEPNPRACEKFGGCPYKDRCNLTGIERIRSMSAASGKGSSDLMARLAERAGSDTPVAAPPAPVVPPSLDWLFAPKDPGPGASMKVAATAEVVAAIEEYKTPVDAAFDAAARKAIPELANWPGPIVASPFPPTDMPINPPEFQRAPTPEEMAAKDAADAAAKAKPAKADGGTPRFRRTAAEVAAGLSVEQAKAARGGGNTPIVPEPVVIRDATDLTQLEAVGAISPEMRDAAIDLLDVTKVPTREEVDAFTPQFVKDGVSDVLKKAETDGIVEKVAHFEAPLSSEQLVGRVLRAPEGFTLYVDCLPLGAEVEPASSVIAEVLAEIKKDLGVIDYRVGAPVEYGKGAGMLSFGVADVAKTRGVDLYLDTRTPEGAIVKEALAGAAARVVQGVGR